MKKLACVFLAFLLFYSVFAKSIPGTIYTAHISGKVNGFKKYIDSANSVNFIINDITTGNQSTYQAKLKSDGSFSINIPKIGAQDIYLEYNNALISILIAPKKQLQITLNADDPEHSLVFGGGYAAPNQSMFKYSAALDKQWTLWYGKDRYQRSAQLQNAIKNKAPEPYKQYVLQRYAKELAFANQYINANKLDPIFVQWLLNDLKYECADNLMRYAWMHPSLNKMKDEDWKLSNSYYNFFSRFPLNNPSATITSSYGSYIAEYSRYLTKRKLSAETDPLALISLYKTQPPLPRDIMLSQYLYSFIDAKEFDLIELLKPIFKSSVANAQFKVNILSKYQQELNTRNNAELPKDALISAVPQTEADSLFSKIVAKYPNKVVYFDFWATWCVPCREEMPNSKLLQTNFKDQDVVFVYLGVQSEEKNWKALIAELSISGEHYLLKNNDYNTLAAKFQISGIPHYVLVNRKGNVFDGNAKRPGDQKLKKEIENLLADK